MSNSRILTAIIPIAGIGSRMLPATKETPKELLPILDKPIIQYIVDEAVSAGIKDIIFISRSGKRAVEKYFERNLKLENFLSKNNKTKLIKKLPKNNSKEINFFTVEQKKQLGLGHAILCSKEIIRDKPFAVLLPDEILISRNRYSDLSRMVKNFHKNGKCQVLVEEVPKNLLSNYGVVKLVTDNLSVNTPLSVLEIIEKPKHNLAPSNKRVVGRYILESSIFEYLRKTKPGKDNEIQLTDSLKDYILDNKDSLQATLSDSQVFDCGSLKGFLSANITLGLKDKELKKIIMEIIN